MSVSTSWKHVLAWPVLVLLLAACSMGGAKRLPEGDPAREWRAAWVFNYEDDIRDEASARAMVEEARDLGLNAIFVVAYSRGQAYYPSLLAPMVAPPGMRGGLSYDPLSTILEEANRNGKKKIQVFAWVDFCSVWRSRDLLPPAHPVYQLPQWLTLPADPARPPDEVPEYWFDPGVPAVQDFAANLCAELAEKYPFDGLLIDSVRYRDAEFGYNPVALQRFARETGRADRPASGDPQWQAWKVRQVTQLVERMALSARLKRPALPIAITAETEGSLAGGYTTSIPYASSAQNWPEWMNTQVADILVLKNFKRQSNADQSREFAEWISYAKLHAKDRALIVGLAARDNALLATQAQIESVRSLRAQGVAFMSLKSNNSEGKPRKALFEFLKETGFKDNARPPHMFWLSGKNRPATLLGAVRDLDGNPGDSVRVIIPELNRETVTHHNGVFVFFGVPSRKPVTPNAYLNAKLYPAASPVTPEPGAMVVSDIEVR